MTTLRDPFATVHKKDIKNKRNEVVAQVDYVGWSQSADRLDEASEVIRWSFSVITLGSDWAHGRLTIVDAEGNERYYENIGYAENAEAEWKKEPLKDAVSDAFKRCAALAGVARYLYDKDAPRGTQPARNAPQRPPAAPVAARPHLVDTDILEPDPEWVDDLFAQPTVRVDLVSCPIHAVKWAGEPGDLWHKTPDGKYCRHPDNVQKARAR
jgi:hypothetical protein